MGDCPPFLVHLKTGRERLPRLWPGLTPPQQGEVPGVMPQGQPAVVQIAEGPSAYRLFALCGFPEDRRSIVFFLSTGQIHRGDGAVFAADKEGCPALREMDGARAIATRKLLALRGEPRLASALWVRQHVLPSPIDSPFQTRPKNLSRQCAAVST